MEERGEKESDSDGGKELQDVTEGGEKDELVSAIFNSIQESFLSEQTTREAIRNVVHLLEQASRKLVAHFSLIHQTPQTKLTDICDNSETIFQEVRVQLSQLKEAVPLGSYYRFHDHWKCVMQKLSFLCLLKFYLERSVVGADKLATRETVAALLEVESTVCERFHLELDDYLMGLLLLGNELSRLAVNSVILGDNHVPGQILAFLSEISSGFRLLNLKNDSLRRKFDALKYDVKKVEEVVYDVTIRGLEHKSELLCDKIKVS